MVNYSNKYKLAKTKSLFWKYMHLSATRFGHVTHTKLGVRRATLISFCKDFKIKIQLINSQSLVQNIDKNIHLDLNFVYFLLENKTFIQIYELDYYSNKTIEIISNKIGRKEKEIEDYLQTRNYRVDVRYPLRYISSYKIDYELGGNYNFLEYDPKHMYEGNFEFRRRFVEHQTKNNT